MCHAPFNTAVERIRVIGNLRKEEVTFPPGFEDNKPKESAVIRELLNHNPYDRPSSEDVLHSDYMPLNMEDSQLHEVLKHTLASSNTTRYRDMMGALFSQQPSVVVDYTYDLQFHQTAGFSTLQPKLQQNVRERLVKVCSRHGAVEVRAPLLLPNNSIHQTFDNRVQVMDTGGRLLTLPYDFRVPFARLLARSRISNLKRYCIGQVYRDPRMHDAHPKEPWECAFDIVTAGTNRLVPDAEVIYLVSEVINEFPPLQVEVPTGRYITIKNFNLCLIQQTSGYSVLINHTSMLSAILHHCSVPEDQHIEVCSILWDAVSGKLRWEQTRKQLSAMGLSESTVGSLENFVQKRVPIHQVRSVMAPVFKDRKTIAARARDGLSELETMASHLKAFGLVQDVVVWLGLAYKLSQFSGVMFLYAAGPMAKKRRRGPLTNVLAAGGRYDKLISDFQSSVFAAAASCSAVGVSIAVDRIVNAMAESEETNIPGVCEVLVYSVRSEPLNECVQIVRDLWTAGISSQLLQNSEQLYSLDDLQTRCKDLGISHIVLLTEKVVYDYSTVRVRSLEKDKVVDKSILRSELVDYLQSRITNKPETTELFQSVAASVKGQPAQGASWEAHSSSQLPIGVTVLTADKTASNIKRRYQSLAMSKASQILQGLSNRQNVEVLAVDLPQSPLSDLRLILNATGKEDRFTADVRAIVDKYSLRSRQQYLDRLIETIRDLRNGKKKTAAILLYSISDDRCEILL
jgi:translation initiation factor 2-alpha kinase 4